MSSGFDEDRQKWAIRMQRKHAVEHYTEFWDHHEIIHNDDENEKVANLLDYFGDVDKIISVNGGSNIYVAQRFRNLRSDNKQLADFSFRSRSENSDAKVELQRMKESYENDRHDYPSRYAFGRTQAPAKKWEKAEERGFWDLYILDTKTILDAIFSGDITHLCERHSGGGVYAKYYSMEDIRDIGAVLMKWSKIEGYTLNPPAQKRPNEVNDITAWANI